ncbi:MAG: DUF84 family protein [Verrucomicrobia bacterium]|nr:DUF84 family protein [Verrucomicrobiota bacterium]
MTIISKYFFPILFGLVTLFGKSQCAIIEAPDLTQFEVEIKNIDDQALVVFDLYNTIIAPSDMILRRNAKPLFKEIDESIQNDKTFVPHHPHSDDHLKREILKNMKFEPVDPKFPKIIQELSERGVLTMAISLSNKGNFGSTEKRAGVALNHLAQVGLDFKKSFLESQAPVFEKPYSSAVFKDGVLFAPKMQKGKILAEFLKKMNLQPSKIIFMDNNLKSVESVDSEMKSLGIDTLCFHYTQAETLPFRADETIAEFQIRNLRQSAEWISDEEARNVHKSERNALIVAVGSKSGVKVKSTQNALEKENVIITPCPARSHVQDQPLTEEETKLGALNRAKDCLAKTDAEIAFGLESGVFFQDDEVYLCNWGVLIDRNDKMYVTNSPNILLPKEFKDDLLSGKPLKDIIHDFTGMQTEDNNTCAIALFTNHSFSREKQFTEIVKTLWEQYHYFKSQEEP